MNVLNPETKQTVWTQRIPNTPCQGTFAVFTGSSLPLTRKYHQSAFQVGQILSQHRCSLIMGGDSEGLMGMVSQGYLHEHLPHQFHQWEALSLYDRLNLFSKNADGCIMIPGGLGTWHEGIDMCVRLQQGMKSTPLCILNDGGYWDAFKHHLERMVHEGLLDKKALHDVTFISNIHDLKPWLLKTMGFGIRPI